MALRIEIDRESDGQWVARITELAGLARRGKTRTAALRAVQVEALRTLAGQLERRERAPFGAFAVEPVEGPAILSIRSRAAQTLRDLQESASADGLDELSEQDIEAEIRASRAARGVEFSSDADTSVIKSG